MLDELPFYFNGAGYVNKHRTALFLFEEEGGKLTRLTKESFDVSSAHLSPDGTQLLFTGESYTTKRKLRSGVYRYDFATGETAQLLAPRTLQPVRRPVVGGEGAAAGHGPQALRHERERAVLHLGARHRGSLPAGPL